MVVGDPDGAEAEQKARWLFEVVVVTVRAAAVARECYPRYLFRANQKWEVVYIIVVVLIKSRLILSGTDITPFSLELGAVIDRSLSAKKVVQMTKY